MAAFVFGPIFLNFFCSPPSPRSRGTPHTTKTPSPGFRSAKSQVATLSILASNATPTFAYLMDALIAQNEEVASEVEVLKSIYGDECIKPWTGEGAAASTSSAIDGGKTIRYQVALPLLAPHEDVTVDLLVSLPPDYPEVAPPQLQLLSRYIGPFKADSDLFGRILRTYISVSGVDFIPGLVCVFDGVQHILEHLTKWYEEHLSAEKAGDLQRELEKEAHAEQVHAAENDASRHAPRAIVPSREPPPPLPEGIEIFEAEPIVDRKSVFIGRAVRITHPSQVPVIIANLLEDRKTARAAHPTIHAWRCQVGTVLHQDNDDDGETAAGGRLAHLLQIMEINNVLVVVTRFFGGIHLGPDRFKHINQAARDALEGGGFLDEPGARKHTGRKKK